MRRPPIDLGLVLFFAWALLVLALTLVFVISQGGCGLTGKGGAPTCPAHLTQGGPGPSPAACPDVRR